MRITHVQTVLLQLPHYFLHEIRLKPLLISNSTTTNLISNTRDLQRLIRLHMQIIHESVLFQCFYVFCKVDQHSVLVFKLGCQFITKRFMPSEVPFHSLIHAIDPVRRVLCLSDIVVLLSQSVQHLWGQFVHFLHKRSVYFFIALFKLLIVVIFFLLYFLDVRDSVVNFGELEGGGVSMRKHALGNILQIAFGLDHFGWEGISSFV